MKKAQVESKADRKPERVIDMQAALEAGTTGSRTTLTRVQTSLTRVQTSLSIAQTTLTGAQATLKDIKLAINQQSIISLQLINNQIRNSNFQNYQYINEEITPILKVVPGRGEFEGLITNSNVPEHGQIGQSMPNFPNNISVICHLSDAAISRLSMYYNETFGIVHGDN